MTTTYPKRIRILKKLIKRILCSHESTAIVPGNKEWELWWKCQNCEKVVKKKVY